MDRMDRLVTQMLALSRLETTDSLPQPRPVARPAIVEQAMSDVLPLAERRHIELDCLWPPHGQPALPLQGDADLLTVLLRNLLDNAVRYADDGSTVTTCVSTRRGWPWKTTARRCPDIRTRLGERFHRVAGQRESGSGLGVSIVQRIAKLHGLG